MSPQPEPGIPARAEILVEDKHAGAAETATVWLDVAAWLKFLPRRLKRNRSPDRATILPAGPMIQENW